MFTSVDVYSQFAELEQALEGSGRDGADQVVLEVPAERKHKGYKKMHSLKG